MPKDFHHYKGNDLTPSEKVEREFIRLVINSKLPDFKRPSSKIFEIKHASGCVDVARILAQKRGLDMDIADAASTLHDIYTAVAGKSDNHAKLGVPMAEKVMRKIGGFTEKQINIILEAIAHHSEKEVYSDKTYVELIKDADVFECSLYKGAENYYRLHKSEAVFKEYVKRIIKVRKELGLPVKPVFRV